MRVVFLSIFSSLVVLSLLACGRKGPPKPPEDFAPKPVINPTILGTTEGAVLSWTAPEEDEDEDDVTRIPLAGFEIHRTLYRPGKDDEYDEVGRVALGAPEEKNYTFTDSEVEPGRVYLYQIKPHNSDNVAGEAAVTLRITYLGENSSIELIPEKSKRPERIQLDMDDVLPE